MCTESSPLREGEEELAGRAAPLALPPAMPVWTVRGWDPVICFLMTLLFSFPRAAETNDHTGWLRTAEMYPLTVLETKVQTESHRVGVRAGSFRRQQGTVCSLPLPALGGGHFPWLVASSLQSRPVITSPLLFWITSLSAVLSYRPCDYRRACPDKPWSSPHLKSLYHICMSLLPCNIHRFRDYDLDVLRGHYSA